MGAALFKRAGSKGQVSRRASSFVEDSSSGGDHLIDGSSHTSSVDSNEHKNQDQCSDENKTKNGMYLSLWFYKLVPYFLCSCLMT